MQRQWASQAKQADNSASPKPSELFDGLALGCSSDIQGLEEDAFRRHLASIVHYSQTQHSRPGFEFLPRFSPLVRAPAVTTDLFSRLYFFELAPANER